MKVFVVGAGISGLFLSYCLLKDGHDVTIADVSKGKVRTSAYNAGQISTRESFTDIFGRAKSVSVSARVKNSHPRWFELAKRQTLDGYEGVAGRLALRSSVIYQEFLSREDTNLDAYAEVLDLHTGVPESDEKRPGKAISQREISELGYKGFAAGWRLQELSLHPGKLLDHLTSRCNEMGAQFVRGQAALKKSGSVVQHASVNHERLSADAFVVSAGSWAADLCKPLGYDPMILPARGLVLFCETGGKRVVDLPSHYEDEGVTATQHDDHTLRLTSFFELAGFYPVFEEGKKKWLYDTVTAHFARPSKLSPAGVGVGYRPSTPDQLPVVGKVPRVDNCYIVAGSCRKGITLAPVLATLVIQCMRGEPADDLLRPLDPRRFMATTRRYAADR